MTKELISVTVADGKYTIRETSPYNWEALRYGEEWPAFEVRGPDNLHIALAHEIVKLNGNIASLESLRPHWAQGYSSDSLAAQAQTAALSQIWGRLGVSSQTDAMQAITAIQEDNERLRAALVDLLDASESDCGMPGECDEDDEPVGGGLTEEGLPDPMALTFGHLRRARIALGKNYMSPDGTLMNADGTRSIFDDVDK